MSEFVSAATAASGLSDPQQRMLLSMAADTIARRDNVTAKAAAEKLHQAAATGAVQIVGDRDHVAVHVDGQPVVQLVGKALSALREFAG